MERAISMVQASQTLMIVFQVAVALVITAVISRIVKQVFHHCFKKQEIHIKFIQNLLCCIVYFLGFLVIADVIPGVSHFMDTLLAGSGIIAIVVGLAAQESLGNLISGWVISIFRPFEVGDRVSLISYNITGKIEDITLRHTVIKTFTNSRIIVPNSEMAKAVIENSHIVDERSSSFIDVGVSYECDLRKAIRVMSKVIGEHPGVLDMRTEEDKKNGVPKIKVQVREFGSSSINLRANMWTNTVDENFEVASNIRIALKEAFDKEGIEIPYNKVVCIEKREE